MATVVTQDPGLVLSGLNLMMENPDPVTGCRIRALGDDLTPGDPEAVIASVQSQLQDGDLERVDRSGNRSATIPLVLDAPGSPVPGDAIAQGQAALDTACTFTGWTELQYTSVLAGAETTVFEVTSATVSAGIDDLQEMKQGKRYVTLTIHARPFVRGTTPETIDAPPVIGSATTTVDDGSSTTGWSPRSTRPAALHNLIDPDAWTASGNTATITGNSSTTGGVYWTRGSAAGNSYIASNLMTVTPGESYRVDAAFLPGQASGTHTMGVLYRWYKADGTTRVGSDATYSTTASGSAADFQPKWFTVKAPAGAERFRIFPFAYYPKVDPNDTGAFVTYVSVRLASEPAPGYFGGDTPDTAALNYAWDSIEYQSTSTATWTAPALAVVSGAIRGTVYGRPAAQIRRTGTIDMTTQPYIRIKGTASAFPDGQVIVNDNSQVADIDPSDYGYLTTTSYSYNSTTGAFDIVIHRPGGFTNLDVAFVRGFGATIDYTKPLFVSVDSIEITDNPFATGKVQTRQVTIHGSQRTELSLEVLGLDDAGTTPVGLGEQVLVHTAAAGSDGRAKFLDVRTASGVGGTPDATAVTGDYNDLPTTSAPLPFTFPASALLPGNYLPVLRIRHSAALAGAQLYLRAHVTAAGGQTAYDPRTGWRTIPLTVVASGAAWPQLNTNTWGMIPHRPLRLPPADIEDLAATITIEVACDAAVDLDDIFLCNADVGQASLLLTSTGASSSFSAVRLDAATVDAPQPSAWVGVANGAMIADAARWFGEQHQAAPGLLQIGTVTPGCDSSRVSGSYFRRNHTNLASLAAS